MLGGTALLSIFIILFGEVSLPALLKQWLFKYGEISYSVYLFHNVFIAIAILLLIHWQINDAFTRVIMVLTIGGGASLLFSLITYRYIEQPYINKGRSFTSFIAQRR